MRKIALIIRIYFKNLTFFFMMCIYFSPKAAPRTNGVPNPKEKINISIPPCTAVPADEANKRIDPRIGPIHGDHPHPRANPKAKELLYLPGLTKEGILIPQRKLNIPIL